MIKRLTKAAWRKKDFLWLTGYSSSWRKARAGSQGKKLEAGTVAETMEKCCFLVCSSQLPQLAFFYKCGSPAKGIPACSGLDPPTSITSQEKASQAWPQANLMKVIPQLRFCLPRWCWLVSSWQLTSTQNYCEQTVLQYVWWKGILMELCSIVFGVHILRSDILGS